MKTSEFTRFAAKKFVADFIDSKIIGEEHAFEVGFTLEAAMEAAVQHALIGVAAKLAGIMPSTDLYPEAPTDEASLVRFINDTHPLD